MISKENQKLLTDFLVNILKDTKSIYVDCDCSHHDLYSKLEEKFDDLNLIGIREDWNINNPTSWTVKIDFRYPLRYLIGEGEEDE